MISGNKNNGLLNTMNLELFNIFTNKSLTFPNITQYILIQIL